MRSEWMRCIPAYAHSRRVAQYVVSAREEDLEPVSLGLPRGCHEVAGLCERPGRPTVSPSLLDSVPSRLTEAICSRIIPLCPASVTLRNQLACATAPCTPRTTFPACAGTPRLRQSEAGLGPRVSLWGAPIVDPPPAIRQALFDQSHRVGFPSPTSPSPLVATQIVPPPA